ncbi:MAG: hypothetical protein JWN66_3609 [Sphingomonas bacterium]|uniref:hypothetical protein n=1 Tax=Sphingomonas bacterium TaxID=1895847 RepID=UPI0026044BCF|nr:hypothetical protein [Sphingomonas bacterium]MDB5706493.1 hypothetical protein [Sphingomonas bacterium]
MNGTIYFRADHDLVGRVLAEKLRLKAERRGDGDSFRIARPLPRGFGARAAA